MAVESLATPNQEQATQALSEWTDDLAWESLDGVLPAGVWRRLATVNRALYASNHVASLLARDARSKADAADNPKITYEGFCAIDTEALQMAMIELGARAIECLEEVRDNEYGCCGTRRGN